MGKCYKSQAGEIAEGCCKSQLQRRYKSGGQGAQENTMSRYIHFDIVVENLSESDAAQLLDSVRQFADDRGLEIAGDYVTETDLDYLFWGKVRRSLKSLWEDLRISVGETLVGLGGSRA